MEENRGNKRMSSITRKLHGRSVAKQITTYLRTDLIMLAILCAGFFVMQEYTVNGTVNLESGFNFELVDSDSVSGRTKYFCILDDEGEMLSLDEIERFQNNAYIRKHFCYAVMNEKTEEMVIRNVYRPIFGVCMIMVGVLAFQLMGVLFGLYGERRKIKKILEPINEMAMKVDELSKLTLSEERYHEIENALDTIKPGENGTLSLGNHDLKGIEAAMNNLIIRMRDSYRQQSRFVNDASHELRTPITVVQGYVNMLDRWGKEDEKILSESIEAIKNETDHMQHLVEQLLFLARGDSGKTMLKCEDFCLNDMAKEVYEESLMIDEEHIYRFQDEAFQIMIHGDLGLLKQAFRILIDNAAKYTKAGDEIMISVGKDSTGASYIQVQDTGIGMAEKDVANMFERFYRSDEVRSMEGTGLGLSIAKWIVDKHQGHFDILSRTELGTRIRIVLP